MFQSGVYGISKEDQKNIPKDFSDLKYIAAGYANLKQWLRDRKAKATRSVSNE
jgi:pantothenate kinase